MFLTTTLFVLCFCLFIPVFDSSVKFIFDVLYCVHLLTKEGSFFSAFLRNFFLCQDRLSSDVPPHLAQPCYVALGRALIRGMCPDELRAPERYGFHENNHTIE